MKSAKSALPAIAVATLLVLAGCVGSTPGSNATPTEVTGATPADGTLVSDGGGTVQFYISDEKNAIGDFEHLNVTITKIGVHRTGDVPGDAETPSENDTETNSTETVTNATVTPDGDDDEREEEREDDQREEERENDRDRDAEGDATWVEYEVNKTVDLTTLQGANATKLESLRAPNGTYDKVFVYVDGIEGTLTTGQEVNVKLPSSKLHINKGFTVGDGGNVSFVFDMTVHKAGKSGKYILKPVVTESGTDEEVEIRDVDEKEEDDEREDEDEREEGDERQEEDEREEENEKQEDEPNDKAGEQREDDSDEAAENETVADLTAEFLGPVEAGSNATLKVTGENGAVENATVTVDGESVGLTDSGGEITFPVPDGIEELEVEVTKGESEFEIERDLT